MPPFHNAVLENFVHVAINVAINGRYTHWGKERRVGAGSSILPEVTIGKWATM
ncbi:MAG: hypothetical protein R2793_04950 [Flavobacteriaceae bacterium]